MSKPLWVSVGDAIMNGAARAVEATIAPVSAGVEIVATGKVSNRTTEAVIRNITPGLSDFIDTDGEHKTK